MRLFEEEWDRESVCGLCMCVSLSCRQTVVRLWRLPPCLAPASHSFIHSSPPQQHKQTLALTTLPASKSSLWLRCLLFRYVTHTDMYTAGLSVYTWVCMCVSL